MALAIQLDLFEDNSDVNLLYREIQRIDIEKDNMRRSLFARHGDLVKIYAFQQEEILMIKRYILERDGVKLAELTLPVPEKKKQKKKIDLNQGVLL